MMNKKHPYLSAVFIAIFMMLMTVVGNVIAVKCNMTADQHKNEYLVILTVTNLINIFFALEFMKHSDITFREYGVVSFLRGSEKKCFYFLPLVLDIVYPILMCGPDMAKSGRTVLLLFLFSISIGFVEEFYFRGLIFCFVLIKGRKKAVLAATVLFALVHLSTALSGEGILAVFMTICYALVFGLVCVEIVILTESLFQVIIWHAFHDFITYYVNASVQYRIAGISSAGSYLIFEGSQFLILLIYAIYLFPKSMRKV